MRVSILFIAIALFSLALSQQSKSQEVLTIEPAVPIVGNCFPFGEGEVPGWNTMGWIYQDIPAFEVNVGDIIAFDLGAMNDANVMLQIDMAPTTEDGGTNPDLPFTTMVTNNKTPENPRGDDIVGNFEMMFTAQNSFSFPGGGLIIRFSNPSAQYRQDTTCDQVIVHAGFDDPSGNFVLRFWGSDNGLPPYNITNEDLVGGFRIIERPRSPVPTLSEWGLISMAGVLGLVGFMVMRRRASSAGI